MIRLWGLLRGFEINNNKISFDHAHRFIIKGILHNHDWGDQKPMLLRVGQVVGKVETRGNTEYSVWRNCSEVKIDIKSTLWQCREH